MDSSSELYDFRAKSVGGYYSVSEQIDSGSYPGISLQKY